MIKRLTKLFLVLTLCLLPSIEFSGSNFSDQENSPSSLSSGCWTPPSVPVLTYPANNSVVGSGSAWDLDPYMDWADSSIYCDSLATLSYQYESYRDPALTQLAYRSAWLSSSQIPAPNTPDGVYYWRVRSRDGQGNISDFSDPWQLTVDRVNPSTPSLSVTGSYTKSVEENINPANWSTAGQVVSLASDTITNPDTTINSLSGQMYRLGSPDDPGNFAWENRLMQSFATGAKSLSLKYNFFSRDFGPFDDPGFFIRLNGHEIFRLNTATVNPGGDLDGLARFTDWQEFYYDLSSQSNTSTNLSIYSGNTGDDLNQSWAYVDQITTYFVSAPLHATYSLTATDNPSGSGLNRFEYDLDSSGWTPLDIGATFTIPTGGQHTLQYRSIDNANNHSDILTVRLIVDDTPPSAITDLAIDSVSVNTISLSWTAPGNDDTSGRAATYDLRYSTSPIDSTNFDSASTVDHLPSPQTSGSLESFTLTGLNPNTTYYFALKTADEAPNWSDISNLVSATTDDGLVINYGDIVVNEILWIGGTNREQIIEIKNTTDRLLTDLSGLTLKLDGSDIVSFTGTTLPPHGYLLVSTLDNSNTNIGNTQSTIDITTSFDLPRDMLDLVLSYNSTDIDFAWTILEPVTEGVFDTSVGAEKYYSIERTSVPGEGDDPLNWYTCIDTASSTDFFKVVPNVDFRATPKADNRSENEPFSRLRPASRIITPTPTPAPLQVTLSQLDDDYNIILNINNIDTPLQYEIIYTNSIGEQGFAGKFDMTDIVNHQISRQFYIGTCSSGGVCTSDADLGKTATVILTGSTINFKQTFTIK